jgi:surface protein
MSNLFKYCSNFNQPIGNWNTGAVTNMTGIFNGTASFNQPIGNWNTGAVTNMSEAFFGSSFNQPIGNWNTGAVTNMTLMFGNGACLFNQPIGNWNTGAVTDMTDMFKDNITFNQPIGNWNTGNVTSMKNMFRYAVFNQPIGNWNISNVIDMEHMFAENLAFNQPLGGWVFNSSVYTSSFLYNTPIDCINYSQTLYDWASNPNCPSNVILNAATLSNNHFYGTNVVSQRNYLINSKGWTVSGDLVSSGVCCITLQSTLNANACPNYFFNGQTISTTGVYYDTLTNANGCDSIVTLNLTIVGTVTSNQSQTACNAYFFNGQTLTSNGVYLDTLINTGGCDSIITLNLIINQVDNSTTLNGTIITANEVGAVYQWLECPNYTLISGASNQSYTAVSNGYYAVSISNNGCTDTSNCITVNSVGINNINALTDIIISPNPTNGVLNISSNLNQVATIIKVYNSLGQVILSGNHNNLNTKVDISNFSKGMYYIEINANNKIYRTKLLKN